MTNIRPPFLVSYSITTKCNLACKHCYSDSTGRAAGDELSTEEALRAIDDLAQWGIGLLIFDGGEPLCRGDFLELARHASSRGIRVVVGSNGTLIDRPTAEGMVEAGIRAVAISVDGANAETHDAFRGKEGAFHQALEGATACKAKGLPFQFNMVLRSSIVAQVPEMLRLAIESGANAAEFFDLVEAGRAGTGCLGEELPTPERQSVMEWLAAAQEDCPIPIRVCASPMYPLLLQRKEIRPKHFPMETLKRIPYYGRGCAAGMPMGYLVIRANGEVNPCMLLQVNLGNIREWKLTQIWELSPILRQLRDRSLLRGHCARCKQRDVCAGCRGRAFEEVGDMLGEDPACWLAGHEVSARLGIYRGQ